MQLELPFSPMLPNYIGIIGNKGHGKDTFAMRLNHSLKKHNINTFFFALADPIKATVDSFIGATLTNSEYYDYTCRKGLVIFNKEASISAFEDRGYPDISERFLWQQFGTEFAQTVFGKYFWCKTLEAHANETKRNRKGISFITDIRFRHEFDYFLERGTIFIKITRPSIEETELSSHASEMEVNRLPFHYNVINDSTLEALQLKADNVADSILKEWRSKELEFT